MKVLVLGGNGAVGQLAIAELLQANHQVTALVRNASTMPRKHPRLTIEQGDPTNPDALEPLFPGQNAVLSTLGVRKNKKTTVRTGVARNLLAGMKKFAIRKLVWLDAAGVGSSKGFIERSSFLFGRILMPYFLNHMYDDAALADGLIERSGCDWVIVRPMSFTNGPKTGKISVVTDMNSNVKLRLRMSRADVASFLVEQLVADHYVRQMPIIYT
jgi:putative NADH-flavin reductase